VNVPARAGTLTRHEEDVEEGGFNVPIALVGVYTSILLQNPIYGGEKEQ
jgi:hypothetical protein